MKAKPGEPTVLKAYVPKGHSPAYPWIGLLIGAGFAVLLGYPLVLAYIEQKLQAALLLAA